MKRISSLSTYFHKWILPVLLFGFLALVFCGGIAALMQNKPVGTTVGLLLGPLAMAAVLYGLLKWLVFDLVDEVWDCGDCLLVRDKGQEVRIDLAECMNVNYNGAVNPPRITLMLRRPTELGTEIAFLPPFRFVAFSLSPVARDLIERIDATRRN